uniref:Uncharacterized protein n=1 Tax=Tanacetum cinerariifolium TaxID=118510 RepID=A0A6L2JAB2_TANCI|nr:hypothetical protein [Tanacetum cinerariifolium]
MWRSIEKGPYKRPMITNPDNTTEEIIEPLSKMTESIKKQYIADVKVMTYHLQEIPNDIYISVDTCKNAKDIVNQHHVCQLLATRVEKICYHACKAKKATKNHDPLALLAHSNASSLQSHANFSYSLQPYYVTHPSSIADYEDEYQCHYAHDCQKPRVRDAKYFREQMLLAMKDEAESKLKDKENDFMLDNSYGDETLEELTATAVSEANDLNKAHEKVIHAKRKTIIYTSNDDQIDSNIIFDDPYMENKGSTSEHDSNAHDEYCDIQMLAYNVQREAKNQKRLNNELNNKKSCYKRSLRRLRIGSKQLSKKQFNVQNIKKHVKSWNVKYVLIRTPLR